MVVMMPLVAIVKVSARTTGERADTRAFAAARQRTDHGASGRTNADSLHSADMPSVPAIRMIIAAMMVNYGCRRRRRS